jgi:rod shape-determining protein MreC
MNRILEVLKRYFHLIVFAILTLFSILLIFNFNSYHKSVLFNSSNDFSGSIYNIRSAITEYIGLSQRNKLLQNENKILRRQVLGNFDSYTDSIYRINDTIFNVEYEYIDAQVVKNSINKEANYLTVNRGKKHGIKPGMGVISPKGIVGIVKSSSQNFSLVISCLNTKEFGVASLIKELELNDGVLKWDAKDPEFLILEGVNKFEKIEKGMEVVTSMYSRKFPANTPIGTIEDVEMPQNGSFYELTLKLSTDFKRLNEVYIVKDIFQNELDSLEVEE